MGNDGQISLKYKAKKRILMTCSKIGRTVWQKVPYFTSIKHIYTGWKFRRVLTHNRSC